MCAGFALAHRKSCKFTAPQESESSYVSRGRNELWRVGSARRFLTHRTDRHIIVGSISIFADSSLCNSSYTRSLINSETVRQTRWSIVSSYRKLALHSEKCNLLRHDSPKKRLNSITLPPHSRTDVAPMSHHRGERNLFLRAKKRSRSGPTPLWFGLFSNVPFFAHKK